MLSHGKPLASKLAYDPLDLNLFHQHECHYGGEAERPLYPIGQRKHFPPVMARIAIGSGGNRKHGNGASSDQPQEIMPIVLNPEQEQTRQLQRDERVNRFEVKSPVVRERT